MSVCERERERVSVKEGVYVFTCVLFIIYIIIYNI